MNDYLRLGIKINLIGGTIIFILSLIGSYVQHIMFTPSRVFFSENALFGLFFMFIGCLIIFLPISIVIILIKFFKSKK